MSNGHGGARPGSGRKRKALAEKILYAGNGNHKITKLKEPKKKKELSKENCPDISGNDMPPVSEYLKKMTKNTNENIAPEIYEKTWQWLKERGCEQFVKVELIEQYALYIARWVQCEEGINSFGLLGL